MTGKMDKLSLERVSIALTLLLFSSLCVVAQTADKVLDKVAKAYNTSLSAHYTINSSQGGSSGNIAISGSKFRILSPNLKIWFNGKTQWAYLSASEEVNISSPNSKELQQMNPYIAVTSLKKNSKLTMAKRGNNYVVTAVPKTRSEYKSVVLTISSTDYRVYKIVFEMNDKTTYTTLVSGYTTNNKITASTFSFDKNLVPKGTQVVDLR